MNKLTLEEVKQLDYNTYLKITDFMMRNNYCFEIEEIIIIESNNKYYIRVCSESFKWHKPISDIILNNITNQLQRRINCNTFEVKIRKANRINRYHYNTTKKITTYNKEIAKNKAYELTGSDEFIDIRLL